MKFFASIILVVSMQSHAETLLSLSRKDQCAEVLEIEIGEGSQGELDFECLGDVKVEYRLDWPGGVLWVYSNAIMGSDKLSDKTKGAFKLMHSPSETHLKCEWEKINQNLDERRQNDFI